MNFENWFNKRYKLLLVIPVLILLICLVYISIFYTQNGALFLKDVSLSGGTTITLQGDFNFEKLESKLSSPSVITGSNFSYKDLSFRKLSNLQTGEILALVIESPASPEETKEFIQNVGNITLNNENSSIEFTGASLSEGFYKQLMIALLVSFICMSLVIVMMFKTFIPSIAVIFAAFADIVMTLALVNVFGIKLSAAGIAAFLMLIGYSVDTDILLTSRALKKGEGNLNSRIFQSFKTGILMTATALLAVLPAFFVVTGLPESFKQIFLILSIGLFADIINTWLTNVGIIKWYCTREGIL